MLLHHGCACLYSIEEAKQKAEHDRRVKLAEKKKLETKRAVELLRREFRALFGRDEILPSHMRLTKLDFQMDPLIQKEVESAVEEKVSISPTCYVLRHQLSPPPPPPPSSNHLVQIIKVLVMFCYNHNITCS